VFGATGAQGGSVVRALLRQPSTWKVVALTRNVDSEKAKELKSLGAELRSCDMSKPEDVEAVLKGSYAVFGVTDFWGTGGSKEAEVAQGINIVNGAKKAGVQHLVLSALDSPTKITNGKIAVPHFDSKAEFQEHLINSGVPYTIVQAAAYFENAKGMVKPNAEGHLSITLPIPADSKFAQFSVAETGLVVRAVLDAREKYLGKKIAIVGDVISGNDIAATLSKQIGKPVTVNQVPEKVFASFGFPGAEEIANMFTYFDEYGYYGEKVNKRDIWEGKAVAPELSTFAQWAAKNWN